MSYLVTPVRVSGVVRFPEKYTVLPDESYKLKWQKYITKYTAYPGFLLVLSRFSRGQHRLKICIKTLNVSFFFPEIYYNETILWE